MICSKKNLFAISFTLSCISASLWCAEPNEAKIGLTFETNRKKAQLWIGRPLNGPGRGPIKPSHVAVLHLRRPHIDMPGSHEGILQILRTPAAKALSEQQRKFLTASDAVAWWGIHDIQNHDTVFLYAVSEEEAKKTAQAYLEVATDAANERMQLWKTGLIECKENLARVKKELPEKTKQVEEAESRYRQAKNDRYFSLEDGQANERAMETMLQMDKMLDVLEIELAGIQEKLDAIERYRKPKDLPDTIRRKRLPDGMLTKLEQMSVEQTIELKSAKARKQAALKIRERDKIFLLLFRKWENLYRTARELKNDFENAERERQRIEERLAKPTPEMLPPVVYQNKVIIYPVVKK
ncbi:hypothetical protein ACFL5Z_15155 [Planctomycetota bacterium]